MGFSDKMTCISVGVNASLRLLKGTVLSVAEVLLDEK